MQIFFYLVIIIIFLSTYFVNSVEVVALIGLIEIVLCLFAVVKAEGRILSLCSMFLLFSYILHCGQYLLLIIDTNVVPTFDFAQKVTAQTLLTTGKFTIYAHGAVSAGIIMYISKTLKVRIRFRSNNNSNILFGDGTYLGDKKYFRTLRYIAYVFITVGLFFSLRTTTALIALMRSGGYYNTFAYYANYGGIRTQLSTLWVVGIIILMMINRKNVKRCRILFLVSLGYLFATMLTGARISAFMNIMVLIFCYFNLVEKLKLGKIIILGIISVFLIQYVVNIGLSRTGGFGVSVDFGTSVKTLIGQVLAEFGGTIYTVALTMDYVPKDIPFAYGLTYLLSFIYIFPNFGWASLDIMSATVYTNYLRYYTTSGIGGSYIGEAYYNAGYFGLLLLILFGLFLGWFEMKIKIYMEEGKWLKLIAYMGTMPYVLLTTRSFFKDIVRPFVWLSVGVLLLYRLFVRRKA